MTLDITVQEAEAAIQRLATPPMIPDPYPLYDTIRRVGRVFESTTLGGAYAVTGYKEVAAAAKMGGMRNGVRAAAMQRQDWQEHESLRLFLRALVNLDAPEHTALREVAAAIFTPNAIRAMRTSIEQLADRYLDDLAEHASGGSAVDLVEVLSSPFPVAVISEMLGVPANQGMLFYKLANDWTRVWGGGNYSDEDLAQADASVTELRGYFDELIRERRSVRREDLISALVDQHEAGRLDDEDLMALATFLFISGFETTTNLISMGLYTLLENPDQLRLWRENPDITPSAVEELLRHGTPISGTIRLTAEPIELGGLHIPPGKMLFLMTAGANRDPEQFPDPDRLDLTRADGAHVSFGGGAHYCLGANLARMEAQVVFPALLRRFPTIEVSGTPEFRTAIGLHGFERLPVVLGK
ncbi:cytochrome P450 [Embleya scabrispora]|uniref:Putative cytochrome P450 monooxygenase n=1 Tax=Embleya scabrispora TaxID=159449 RepID=A0A0F7R6H2_9ACTN|nr:cytochrome P450 [Embleya scabrispora]BAR73013.1 putative cytochrome P450 monooxygenase [Embleya scabrispora]